MRKLTLKLDDLRIDSFQTTPGERGKGTVFGEQCTCWTNCTCPGCPTCDASCNGTCGGTCDASCNGTCGDSCGCDPGTGDCTWFGYTCDNSCQGGWSCDPTCGGYITMVGPQCMIC